MSSYGDYRGDAPFAPVNVPHDEDFGVLQELVDAVFRTSETTDRIGLVTHAEIHDVSADVMEVVELMPPGTYTRGQMADQMNSIITAHGWGLRYGTVA